MTLLRRLSVAVFAIILVVALDFGAAPGRAHASPAQVMRSGVISHGVMYVGSTDHKLYALRAATGKKLWALTTRDVVGVPAVAGGVVYVGSDYDHFYAVKASTGRVLWTALKRPKFGDSYTAPVIS